MAFLPGFTNDLFISYAHLNEGADKWVSRFQDRLEAQLKQLAGRELKIWRDLEQLPRDHLVNQTIKAELEASGLFLALHSHAYDDSPYCRQEVQWFCDHVQNDDWGLSIGNRKRIVPALLSNIPVKEKHPVFGDVVGYPFYKPFPKDDTALPCDPDSEQFKNGINELVSNLFSALRAFKQEIENKRQLAIAPNQPTGSHHIWPSSSVLLDTNMKDDDHAIEVHKTLRSLNIKSYLNQSEDDVGDSIDALESRLKRLGRMIIVFNSVQESWVFRRLSMASEIANSGEKIPLKLGIYYGPQRTKGNGGQLRIGSLTVYELDGADLRNPQALLPLFS